MNQIKENEIGKECNAWQRSECKVLVRKTEGTRSYGRPGRRWEDNVKMDLKGTGAEDVDWMYLAQDRDKWPESAYTVINLRIQLYAGNLLSNYKLHMKESAAWS
jgi:hypothetical protein